MTTISATQLANVRVHGLGLTDDFLLTLSERAQTAKVDRAKPASYDLPPKMSLEEAILDAWDDARKAWTRFEQYRTDPWAGWVRPLLKTLDYSFPGGGATGGKYAVRFLSETGDVPLHYAAPVMSEDDFKAADLDRVTLHATLRASPHGLMQGYLNATPEHLWGLVTNGEVLRVLRNNAQVTRPAYAEFNIGEMMRTEDARAFRVLFLLLHRSRLKGAKDSILESWNTQATGEGVKARDSLRDGVQRAIEHLGTGFLTANAEVYEQVKAGTLTPTTLYRACLKMVYQMVFLFVTEDRDLLFGRSENGEYVPDAATRERAVHYLTRAMRTKAAILTSTNIHTDAYAGWERLLGYVRVGFAPLGLPALGSHLFQSNDLTGLKLGNQAFYAALSALSEITVDGLRRPVNYAGLDSEELGSIYESLLELVPRIQPGPRFELQTLAGNERKTTGSYYTPTGLINLLLDSALEPVIEDAIRDKLPQDAIAALKKLKIIDPACGSGHFLIAAARRIGARLAELEEETSQPSPAAQRRATRTVIAHCIYGADINPMAIELAKVALWLESQDAGKPLAFLDHRLRVGNSLLGTTPELMNAEDEIPEKMVRGVLSRAVKARTLHLPDAAFSAIEGDDESFVAELKKRNKQEREYLIRAEHGAQLLDFEGQSLIAATTDFQNLNSIEPDSIEAVRKQEAIFAEIRAKVELDNAHILADVWCAAFVSPKTPTTVSITTATLNALSINPYAETLAGVRSLARVMAEQYSFLHPHIEFPDVFITEQGGFNCVLGNPPWERVQFEEQDYFASINEEIAVLSNQNERKNAIALFLSDNSGQLLAFSRYKRESQGIRSYIANSGRFSLTAFDKFNYYAIFSELAYSIKGTLARVGIIVKSGLIFDKLTSNFLEHLAKCQDIVSVLEFQNKIGIFPGVHRQERFALVTLGKAEVFTVNMNCITIDDAINNSRSVNFDFTSIKIISPNTFNIPMTDDLKSLKIMSQTYSRIGAVSSKLSKSDFDIDRYINVSDFSDEISNTIDRDHERGIFEGKMIGQFDIVRENGELNFRNYISNRTATRRNPRLDSSKYFIVARDITNKSNERSIISAIIPDCITDYTLRVFKFSEESIDPTMLVSALNSFILDYLARLKIGGTHLANFIIEQLPIITGSDLKTIPGRHFITPRVLELTYTAFDLTGFARDLTFTGDPFTWNDERRFWLRAELDALYFILYGIERDDMDYIMETFPIVKKKDMAAHGRYRTKDAILAIYDELQALGLERLGEYQSRVLTLELAGGDVAGGWRP